MIRLFEIKIYPFTPNEFNEKIRNVHDKFFAQFADKDINWIQARYSERYGCMSYFEDYSNGHISILYDAPCLRYECNIMLSRKYPTVAQLRKRMKILKNDDSLSEEDRLLEAKMQAGYTLVPYRSQLFSGTKHYTTHSRINGIYTNIDGLDNTAIANKIIDEINRIHQRDMFRNLYFDMTLFNTIGRHIDYNKIINSNKKCVNI